jgi:hypothetical protein
MMGLIATGVRWLLIQSPLRIPALKNGGDTMLQGSDQGGRIKIAITMIYIP